MVAVGGRLTTARERAALVENLRERAVGADRGGVVVDSVVSDGRSLLLARGLLLILLLGLSVGLPFLIVILLLLATLVLLLPLLLVLARRLVLLLLLPVGPRGRRSVVIVVVTTAHQREARPRRRRRAPMRAAALGG